MGSNSIHVSSLDNYLDSMDTFFGTSQCALGFLQIAIKAMHERVQQLRREHTLVQNRPLVPVRDGL